MTVPPGVNYVKIERIDNENDILVQCSAPSVLTNNTLHCDIGNPLPQNKYVSYIYNEPLDFQYKIMVSSLAKLVLK